MGSSKKQTIGYKYHLGMHMILCHGPIDKITQINVDNKKAWSGSSTGGQIFINSPTLFGGDEREGGVGGYNNMGEWMGIPIRQFSAGDVDIEMGRPTQGRNTYLQRMLGLAIPAFRGVVGIVLRRCYLGNNPYLKLWAFRGTRIHVRQDGIAQWYDAKAEVLGDMNPAHIIREVLTDPDWGMGYPEGDMNEDAFRAAADQLAAEGMGMSILWDKQQQLDDFLAIILRHIDASLYTDRLTGQFVLKLARGGYNVNTLQLLDETVISRITDFKRATIDELTNQVSVTFWDKSTGKDNSVTVQDIALAASQGATVGTTVQYPGFTNGTIATRVAARDLKALSTPLATATLYVTRVAANLNIGDVFKLSWAEYGIQSVVFRVTNVELGDLTSNLVKLSVIEDVFSLSDAIYAPPPPSEWVNPIGPPVSVQYRYLTEIPYYFMARSLGDSAAQVLAPTAGYLATAGARPSGGAIAAQILVNETSSTWEQRGTMTFCPTATIAAEVRGGEVTDIAITGGVDLEFITAGSLAVLGTGVDNSNNAFEIVQVTALTDTTVTVRRGMLDTTPRKSIAAGVRILFLGQGDFLEELPTEYASGEYIQVRQLTTTPSGTLPLANAPIDAITIASNARQNRPNPPGRLRLTTSYQPNTIYEPEVYGPTLTANWAHRDRLQQTGATLVLQDASSIGPEAGVTYWVRWFIDNSQVRSQTGVTGLTDAYTPPAGSGGKLFQVEILAQRAGQDAWRPLYHEFRYRAQMGTETGGNVFVTEAGDRFILE
ncbi:putative virion structural protein [Stenotrophomonas phage A1432]|uniref:Virion structural protein n=1 Tax=Stenotrophomonas phage A1432 TaxID=2930315 RepID=A0A9E7SQM4_9CAUD|nr:putative virion structural protein [Stenotrophomonas phage A1432]UTC27982.1 putative virion structural protein [Stenotrophomonas phage A1432]